MYYWFKENPEDFNFKECIINSDLCVLITSKITVKWTDSNKIYRSSIWRVADGFPVSLSFKKFTNFGEQPDFEPISSFYDKNFIVTEKLDGSCLIVSKYKGKLIARTRGTFDARILKNGHELDPLLEKYKIEKYFDPKETADYSLLFEWVSPDNQIILKYNEPDLFLIGGIKHADYSYFSQNVLNSIAHTKKLKRPRIYEYSDLSSYLDLKNKVEQWTSQEGIVLYFNNGQLLKKMKSEWYCKLHNLKSSLSSFSKIAECMYLNGFLVVSEKFNRAEVAKNTYKFIQNQFDFEIAEFIKPTVKSILDRFENNLIRPFIKSKKCLTEISIHQNPKEVLELFEKYPDLNKSITWKLFRNKDTFSYLDIFKIIKINTPSEEKEKLIINKETN